MTSTKDSKREMIGMSTITSKFQVTIPKKLRDKHDLKGDSIAFVEESGNVYLVKSDKV